MGEEILKNLALAMDRELKEDILPYWYQTMDLHKGGFVGKVNNDGTMNLKSPKGVVMHSRHLWGYAQAWLYRRNPSDLTAARHAYRFLTNDLRDKEHRGFWWIVDAKGKPDFDNKVIYGQAFAIYGLSQYYLASGEKAALDLALETFLLVEKAGRDHELGGYYEAVDRTWSKPITQALSDVDIPCSKSMNTNLHYLEALSALYRASGRQDVKLALQALLDVFLKHIMVSPAHLGLYFDRDWKNLSDHVSFGHDIEASWLMSEAAELVYGHHIPDPMREAILTIAQSCRTLVFDHGGSLPNELHQGQMDTNRVWWVQSEAMVGMVNAWQLSGETSYLVAARRIWDFVDQFLIDRKNGEWFWLVDMKGNPSDNYDKGGLWKTCYHNGRACMEVNLRWAKSL